jgi:hypothetical protein
LLTLMIVKLIAHAQEPPPMTLRTPATIIDSFIKTETQLRQSLNQHTFKRDVVLQTIGPNGNVTGEYIRNSQFLFDDKGNRIERVTYHPPPTIREMRITKEDIKDLAGSQLLGVDILESGKYQLTYKGQEFLDGKRVYQLTVEPVVRPNPYRMSERFFRGSVWIDTANFQIVKVRGIVEPQGKQRFPTFETWREPVTSTFNFPTRTEADDVCTFRIARSTIASAFGTTTTSSSPAQLVSRNCRNHEIHLPTHHRPLRCSRKDCRTGEV